MVSTAERFKAWVGGEPINEAAKEAASPKIVASTKNLTKNLQQVSSSADALTAHFLKEVGKAAMQLAKDLEDDHTDANLNYISDAISDRKKWSVR